MDEWQDRIKDDLSLFDTIKDSYRQDVEEIEKQMSERGEEIAEEETLDGPGIVISNPPKEWKGDVPTGVANLLIETGAQRG